MLMDFANLHLHLFPLLRFTFVGFSIFQGSQWFIAAMLIAKFKSWLALDHLNYCIDFCYLSSLDFLTDLYYKSLYPILYPDPFPLTQSIAGLCLTFGTSSSNTDDYSCSWSAQSERELSPQFYYIHKINSAAYTLWYPWSFPKYVSDFQSNEVYHCCGVWLNIWCATVVSWLRCFLPICLWISTANEEVFLCFARLLPWSCCNSCRLGNHQWVTYPSKGRIERNHAR